MTNAAIDRTEAFMRDTRRNMIMTLVAMILVGVTTLVITLTPNGAAWRTASLGSLGLVFTATILILHVTLSRRRWNSALPEVQIAEADEWRRSVVMRASRATMVLMLCAEWPLALMIGFLVPEQFTPPRVAIAMAGATITLGVVTQLATILHLDRDDV